MDSALVQHRTELHSLCRQFHVQRLELFGSAATGEQTLKSDLDFLIEFAPLPCGGYADAFFGMHEALERLFGRPVDLVVAAAITNPFFRKSVELTKVLVYAA